MNKNDLDYSFTEINSVGSQQDQILHLDWVFVNSGIAGTQAYFNENLLSEGATDVWDSPLGLVVVLHSCLDKKLWSVTILWYF